MNLRVLAPSCLVRIERPAPECLIGEIVAAGIAFEEVVGSEIIGDLGPRQLAMADEVVEDGDVAGIGKDQVDVDRSLAVALARRVQRQVRGERVADQPAQLQPAALAAIVAFRVKIDPPAVRLLDERERGWRRKAAKVAVAVHQADREPQEQPVGQRLVDDRSQLDPPVAAEDRVSRAARDLVRAWSKSR